jgi:hypothetical protein
VEPLTRGLPPPDLLSLCSLSSTEFVNSPPKKNPGYATVPGIKLAGPNNKIKNIRYMYRDIIDFKMGYQRRIDIVKDEKGDLLTACNSILVRWRKLFSQLFKVQAMVSGSLSPRHGGWKSGLQYGG